MLRDSVVKLTPAGRSRLDDELTHLTTVKRPELASRLLESNEDGDISDNSEYEELKEELVMTDARIQDLGYLLDHAETIEDHDRESVGLGSTFTIRGDDGEEETWTLVSHAEADTRTGAISTESPVGQAIHGKRVGEAAAVTTPGGQFTYTVLKIT